MKEQTKCIINQSLFLKNWFILSLVNLFIAFVVILYIYLSSLIPELVLLDKQEITLYIMLYSQLLIMAFGLIGVVVVLFGLIKPKNRNKTLIPIFTFLGLSVLVIVINLLIVLNI